MAAPYLRPYWPSPMSWPRPPSWSWESFPRVPPQSSADLAGRMGRAAPRSWFARASGICSARNCNDSERLSKAMITVLAGGVGAAKFLDGLLGVVPPEEVTVIVNTGDDAQF